MLLLNAKAKTQGHRPRVFAFMGPLLHTPGGRTLIMRIPRPVGKAKDPVDWIMVGIAVSFVATVMCVGVIIMAATHVLRGGSAVITRFNHMSA